jgi:GNAT superfamily N-acetyltransferase
MPVSVRPVRSAKERRQFFDVAYRLNEGDPIWTPPLVDDLQRSLSDKNPLWRPERGERELWLAFDGTEPVGRILSHVHHASNARHREKAGFFGLLECPNDPSVASPLLDAASDWARSRGMTELRGPYELTITQCIGAVVSGFDEPASFSQSWNGPHLPRLLEACGFGRGYGVATFRLDDVASVDAGALLTEKHRAWTQDPKVTLRGFDMKRFDADLKAATSLLNESFSDNFGFVALSDAEIAFMAGPMKRVVRPELTVFLEVGGEPAGVAMALPDFNVLFRRMDGRLFPLGWAQFLIGARTLDSAVLQFMGTSPKFQNLGLMRVVISELMRRLQAAGIRTLDGTWIGESNPKSRANALAVGMREKHKLALFSRPIA